VGVDLILPDIIDWISGEEMKERAREREAIYRLVKLVTGVPHGIFLSSSST
jgi:hypothetical protein